MLHLIATAHACQRARERLRGHARTLERMLDRVFYFGVSAEACARHLRRYLDELPHEPGQNIVRVYGQLVFRELLKSPEGSALRAKRQSARRGGGGYPRRGYPRLPNAADVGMARNPQGGRELRLGRRWARRDIPSRYAPASPALAEPHFPAAQTPPEILGAPFIFARDETAATARLLTVHALPAVHRAAARRAQLRPRTALALAA